MAKFTYVEKVVIDDSDIKIWVQEHCDPEDIFPPDVLSQWVEDNGYIKEEENE